MSHPLTLTQIKACIVEARSTAQKAWDAGETMQDVIDTGWMLIDIDVDASTPSEHNHVCIYSDSDERYHAGTTHDKWVKIWERGENVLMNTQQSKDQFDLECKAVHAEAETTHECDPCGASIPPDADVWTCKVCDAIQCADCNTHADTCNECCKVRVEIHLHSSQGGKFYLDVNRAEGEGGLLEGYEFGTAEERATEFAEIKLRYLDHFVTNDRKDTPTICDKCDNEAECVCPHCGDEYCQACFHDIAEGEHCSEAPDAQPRSAEEAPNTEAYTFTVRYIGLREAWRGDVDTRNGEKTHCVGEYFNTATEALQALETHIESLC